MNQFAGAHPIRRRTLLGGVGAALLTPAVFSAGASPAHAASGELTADGIRVVATAEGHLQIFDGAGVLRETINGFFFTDKVSSFTADVTTGVHNGQQALILTYTGVPSEYQATAYVTVSAQHVSVDYEVVVPDGTWAEGFMIWRTFENGDWHRDQAKSLWEWARDPRGGVPFQKPTLTAYPVTYGDGAKLNELILRGNASWSNQWSLHTPPTQTALGTWRLRYDVMLGDVPTSAMAGALSGRTLALSASTPEKFHWFRADASALTFSLSLFNSGAARDVTLSWTVHDFYGNVPEKGTWRGTAPAGESVRTITTDVLGRGIYFLEATAEAGGESALTRLNLTVMPDRAPNSPMSSPFGLAAVFTEWGREYGIEPRDWAHLIKRIGVKHLRMPQLSADLRRYAGVDTMHHTWVSGTEFRNGETYPNGTLDTAAQEQHFAQILAECREIGAKFEEYGNELNLKGGFLKGAFVDAYMHDYLIPIRRYFDAHGATTGITLQALGGPDHVFLRKCVEKGAWPMIDAVALHPGRGNYTPDYAPDPAGWEQDGYWNFLGGVRKIRQDMDEYTATYGGEKEFLLTEVYAPTFPNSWWEDTYRTSAENTLLTAALTFSERVDRFYWYQMNDSIWSAPGTANDKDREWHFGLTMIDTSFKPMLLAYATAAEHLGDATFKRWLTFDDDNIKGLLFDTPGGELQVIWSRADGYILNADHGSDSFYDEPEPWVDVWKTKTELSVKPKPAVKSVREIDCLGKERRLPVRHGRVRLQVDGAAKLYYGLRSR